MSQIIEVEEIIDELLETCQAFKKLGHRKMKFTIGKNSQPVIIKGEDTSEFQTRAVIMPLNI